MNIDLKLAELRKQYEEAEQRKAEAHAQMKKLKALMGKLLTIQAHAEEIFEEENEAK